MWRYIDGTGIERCALCFAAVKSADGPLVSVRVSDLEELICFFNEYMQCDRDDDVWGRELLVRFEQAIGQTYEQIKEREWCERLSKEVSTS